METVFELTDKKTENQEIFDNFERKSKEKSDSDVSKKEVTVQ